MALAQLWQVVAEARVLIGAQVQGLLEGGGIFVKSTHWTINLKFFPPHCLMMYQTLLNIQVVLLGFNSTLKQIRTLIWLMLLNANNATGWFTERP